MAIDPDVQVELDAIADIIANLETAGVDETRLAALEAWAASFGTGGGAPTISGYTLSGVDETRTINASSVSLEELADVVGTLIRDLQGTA